MGCIWVLLGGKGSLHSRRHEGDGGVSVDTFVREVSSVEQPTPGDTWDRAMKTVTGPPSRRASANTDTQRRAEVWGGKAGVPQAEGQQGAGLLVELQMDALQLASSHQLVRDNGCRALALQAVLPTPGTQRSKAIKCAR